MLKPGTWRIAWCFEAHMIQAWLACSLLMLVEDDAVVQSVKLELSSYLCKFHRHQTLLFRMLLELSPSSSSCVHTLCENPLLKIFWGTALMSNPFSWSCVQMYVEIHVSPTTSFFGCFCSRIHLAWAVLIDMWSPTPSHMCAFFFQCSDAYCTAHRLYFVSADSKRTALSFPDPTNAYYMSLN